MKRIAIAGAAGLLAAVAGCGPREPNLPAQFSNLTADLMREFEETRPEPPLAGTPRELRSYTREELIAQSGVRVSPRRNPFALFGEELAFQTGIRTRTILGHMPGFAMLLEPPEDPVPPELRPVESQPYRRLSGIYFGETISALIEMGDGRTYLVYPGMRVGETEWFVESIDAETLVLVRDSNVEPRRVIVRLESAPIFPGGGRPGGR